jgi:hypothetical protein
MKNKDLKKQLKNLREISINESSFVAIKENLKDYMNLYPVRKEAESVYQKIKVNRTNSPLLKFATVTIISGLILGGGRAVYASRLSLPGEALYPIKLVTENLQKMVIFDQGKKAEFEIRLAEKRAGEIKLLEEKELVNKEEIEKTKNRLTNHLNKATKLSSGESNSFKETIEKNKQIIEKKIKEPKKENAIDEGMKTNKGVTINHEENINSLDIKKTKEDISNSQEDKKISTVNNKENVGKKPEKSDNKNKGR